jgi:hypothetical protein
VQEYCWDSPASLYTFLRYLNPAKLGSGLPVVGFPEFTQFSIRIPTESPEDFRAALYR